jgi:chromosome segregation ATPase
MLCALCVTAQRTRRGTAPRPPAPAGDPAQQPPAPRIISITGSEPVEPPAEPAPKPTPELARRTTTLRMEDLVIEQNSQRRALNRLAGQLEILTVKLGFLEAQQRQTFDLQRLMYAEQRADALRKQLLETQTKQIEIETRLEQVEFEMRPEIVDRASALFGTTRPEEGRELRLRTLQNEKKRLQGQLEILKQNRERLEIAVPEADREVDRLRAKLEQDAKELREKFEAAGQTPSDAPAKPKPSPDPDKP